MKTSILKSLIITASLFVLSCKKENTKLNQAGAPKVPCTTCFTDYLSINEINTNSINGFLTFGHYIDSNNIIRDSTFDPALNQNVYITPFSPFWNKTNKGYYCIAPPTQIKLDYSKLPYLQFTPKKITFTHVGYSRDVPRPLDVFQHYNIQLPGTPLIVSKVDDLPNTLAPYGYTVQVYHYTSATNMGGTYGQFPGRTDSVVITGNDVSQITIGTSFFESEIRNICVYER